MVPLFLSDVPLIETLLYPRLSMIIDLYHCVWCRMSHTTDPKLGSYQLFVETVCVLQFWFRARLSVNAKTDDLLAIDGILILLTI